MSNEVKKEAKGKKAEFQKARPAAEGKTTVIHVARTAKVVKGGKRFGFRALVVVGNGMGKVGVAIGKANQVQLAIAKAESHARKHMITFPIVGETIPHERSRRYARLHDIHHRKKQKTDFDQREPCARNDELFE